MKSKFHIELHYSVSQNDLRIFRTDSFFSAPTYDLDSKWEREDQQLMMKYLSKTMKNPISDCYITVKEIVPDGYDRNGVEKFAYPPIKMFTVKNGAVVVKSWWEEREEYFPGDAMSPLKAIEELRQTLEIYDISYR
jgi:hypothetical protein